MCSLASVGSKFDGSMFEKEHIGQTQVVACSLGLFGTGELLSVETHLGDAEVDAFAVGEDVLEAES